MPGAPPVSSVPAPAAPGPLGSPPSAPAAAVTPSAVQPASARSAPPAAPVVPVPGAPASFAELVERVTPAVVNLYTSQVVQQRVYGFNPWFPYGVPQQRMAESLGSGVLIDGQGHILTNSHVINGATTIRARLADGREFDAQVVGVDPLTDIAVARLEPFDGMRWLELADSDEIRVGDWVVAVGNPFGLNSSVTAGTLSARGRRDVPLGGDVRYIDFLQTDASINPGNSGGPLVDMQGRVVGINTAVNREAQGIGFAIPSNMARDIYGQLVSSGRVDRSWLGVFIETVRGGQDGAEVSGARVSGVVKGGPAQAGGVQPGDIIVRFGDEVIDDSDELAWVASRAGVGTEVDVRVVRDGAEQDLRIVLGAMPE